MNFKNIYSYTVKNIDSEYERYKGRDIVKDKNSSIYGKKASFEMLYDTTEAGYIKILICTYYLKDGKYYKNPEILDKLEEASRQLKDKLNEDGTDTLFVSNFQTPQQFGLQAVGDGALVMKTYLDEKNEKEVKAFETLCMTVEKMAEGCLNGGFHTPNHRWVETSAMLLSYEVLKDTKFNKICPALMKKSEMYLKEGVDCDEYGEWSERSAGMYNIHCDNAFLWIHHILKKDEYLDCICRNLMLMRYYIDPYDSSVFTQNSRRNDKGELGSVPLFNKGHTFYADDYIIPYMYAAYSKKDAFLASIAYKLFENTQKFRRYFDNTVFMMFLHLPGLKDWEFEYTEDALPNTYDLYQPKSNIFRKKTDLGVYSYLANNPSFLQIEAQDFKMKMRMCSSFFAVAQYHPEKMEKTDEGYSMTMTPYAEYKLPLENPDGVTTKDYWTIDYSKRKSIKELTLIMNTEIVFTDENEFEIRYSVSGCDKVPTKLEFFVSPGMLCEIGDAVIMTNNGGNAFSKGEKVRFETREGIVVEIEGLLCNHLYSSDMRGSLDPIPGAFCLSATSFTPTSGKIKIKISKTDSRRIFY